ncbi:TPA: hypothetical protein ACKRPP_000929 [Proteus mirabilis]
MSENINNLSSSAINLIENIISELVSFKNKDFIKERFGNQKLEGIDTSKYDSIIDNIISYLNTSILQLEEKELPDFFLNQIIVTIEQHPRSIMWMIYDQKPSIRMIENQLSRHFNELLSFSFQLNELVESIVKINDGSDAQIQSIIDLLKNKANIADALLGKITGIEQKAKSKSTFEVYEIANERYKDMAFLYQGIFFSLCIVFFILLFVFTFGGFFDLSKKEEVFKFIYFKLTLLVLLSILIAYFLKLASFYRKKAEEAYQTQLELEAFPYFVADMDSKDILEIRKELAKCYFGQMNKHDSLDKLNEDLDKKIKVISDLMLATASIVKETKTSKN